ncbi:MAG: hypothetical protein R3331_09310 [Sulfurospirillaceae bacterium]|nr:hypothetical protein [Sulfurospirillaceae bacterium]
MGWFGIVWKIATGFLKGKSSIMIDVVLVLAVIILIGGGVWKYQNMKHTIALYESKLVTAQGSIDQIQVQYNIIKKVNDDNTKEFEKQKLEYQNTINILQKKYLKDVKITKTIAAINEKARHVKPQDDAPTAKVLIDTLEAIRKMDQ